MVKPAKALQKKLLPRREVDAADLEIMRQLRTDPQMPTKSLAAHLGLSQMTASNRIASLVASNKMKVTMQRDMRTLGYEAMALAEVHVDGGDVDVVARRIGEIEEVFSCTVVMGTPQIFALVMGRDLTDLANILETRIGALPSVSKMNVSMSLGLVRISTEVADFQGESQ